MLMTRRNFALAMFCVCSLFSCGCGRGTTVDRLPIHGTVAKADGEQLNGSISFLPAPGQKGPSATTKLEQGKYAFDRANGPAVGPHKVIIKRVIGREESRKAIAAGQPTAQNGAEWILSVTIADDGQYLQDLTIER
jgi:hypothetical protein